MAIVATHATEANSITSQTSLQVTFDVSFAIGDLCLIAVGCNNAETSGTNPVSGIVDSGGNTYTLLEDDTKSSGGVVNDGVTLAVYGANITTALTTGVSTFTVSFSTATISKVFKTTKITGMGSAPYATGTATGITTGGYSITSGSLASGDLIVAIVATEADSNPGADSDTTNGSWVASSEAANTGTASTSIAMRVQTKVVTGAGTQTFNGSAAGDWVAIYLLYTIPSATAPAQPRSVVPTPASGSVSVAFVAPPGQSLLVEDFTGSDGAAPHARWTLATTGVLNIQSNALHAVLASGEYAWAQLADDYPVDAEICGQIVINQDQQQFPSHHFRSNGTRDTAGSGELAVPTAGFYLSIRPDTNAWTIFRRTGGGSDTSVATAGQGTSAGDVFNIILQFDSAGSNNIRLRLWKQSETEPGAFDQSTDANHAAEKRIGLGAYASLNGTTVSWPFYRVNNLTDPGVNLYRVRFGGGTYSQTGASSPIVVAGVAVGTYSDLVVEASADNGSTWGPTSFVAPSFTVSASMVPIRRRWSPTKSGLRLKRSA